MELFKVVQRNLQVSVGQLLLRHLQKRTAFAVCPQAHLTGVHVQGNPDPDRFYEDLAAFGPQTAAFQGQLVDVFW